MIAAVIVERGFLPAGAVSGDQICRDKGTITVNDEPAAEALDRDRQGRPLPSWEGCLTLIDGEFFLLQPHPYSFDSRYFGPVLRCDVVATAAPLWTWSPDN